MSENTNAAQIAALRKQVAAIQARLAEGDPAKKAPAKKAAARKAPAKKAAPKVTYLTKTSRKAFIKAHDWAEPHMSCLTLAIMVVAAGESCADGWAVGDGYQAKVAKHLAS